MDPENLKKAPAPKEPSITDSTLSDLHDAGIDISSRIPEDNEFSEKPTESAPAEPVAPVSEPAPQPVAEKLQPIQPQPQRQPQPQTTPAPAPTSSLMQDVQNIMRQGGASPAQMQAETASKNDPSIKQLRTFKTDAEEAVRYQNVSAVNIAVAEHKKKEDSHLIQYSSAPKRSVLPIILILALVLILAGGGAYYWFFMREASGPSSAQNIPAALSANTIIPYDEIGSITLSNDMNALSEIGKDLAQANVNIGQVYALIPMPAGTTTAQARLSSIFFNSHMPDRLDRSLANEYMIGTYVFKENSPFIILKNTFFQNAFAGMLEWEKDMRNDLISIVHITHPEEQPVSVNSDIFNDLVVSNIDARVLRNAAGETILAYAFADKDTIVISTDLDTLKYILDRLLSVRVVQ